MIQPLLQRPQSPFAAVPGFDELRVHVRRPARGTGLVGWGDGHFVVCCVGGLVAGGRGGGGLGVGVAVGGDGCGLRTVDGCGFVGLRWFEREVCVGVDWNRYVLWRV